jgi:hypothetical protein
MADLKSQAAWRYSGMGTACFLLVSVAVAAGPDVPRFDGRAWTIGHQQRNNSQSITEYVLPGQTVENWKEMVTSEVYFKPIPISAVVKMFEAKLSKGCPSLVFTVLKQDEQTAVIEWRDSGCGGFEPSSELARFAIEQDQVYRLAYSVKGSLKSEKRKEWMRILEQSPLAERAAREADARAQAQDPERAAAMAKATQVLAGFVRQSGNTCSNPKAELTDVTPGPAGALSEWSLACAEARFTIFVQPNGAMTAMRH